MEPSGRFIFDPATGVAFGCEAFDPINRAVRQRSSGRLEPLHCYFFFAAAGALGRTSPHGSAVFSVAGILLRLDR
jgi:hypothetical protein